MALLLAEPLSALLSDLESSVIDLISSKKEEA